MSRARRALTGAEGASARAIRSVPVKASVFDDEFFRKPKEEWRGEGCGGSGSKHWPDARVPSFAGYAAEPPAENDELDIPAFLRRKQ